MIESAALPVIPVTALACSDAMTSFCLVFLLEKGLALLSSWPHILPTPAVAAHNPWAVGTSQCEKADGVGFLRHSPTDFPVFLSFSVFFPCPALALKEEKQKSLCNQTC